MKHSPELVTFFLPGLTPSAPFPLWRCRLAVGAPRAAPTSPRSGRRSSGQPLQGAAVKCRPSSRSPAELWGSPDPPTRGPTSLTQGGPHTWGCLVAIPRGIPPPPRSLGMNAGNGISLPPRATQGLISPQSQAEKFARCFYFLFIGRSQTIS